MRSPTTICGGALHQAPERGVEPIGSPALRFFADLFGSENYKIIPRSSNAFATKNTLNPRQFLSRRKGRKRIIANAGIWVLCLSLILGAAYRWFFFKSSIELRSDLKQTKKANNRARGNFLYVAENKDVAQLVLEHGAIDPKDESP